MTEMPQYNDSLVDLCESIALLKKRIDREDRLIAQTQEAEFSGVNMELKGVLLRDAYRRKQRFAVELSGLLADLADRKKIVDKPQEVW
jgi:hypothetical protein